jgi:hypothetical protein
MHIIARYYNKYRCFQSFLIKFHPVSLGLVLEVSLFHLCMIYGLPLARIVDR